MSDDRGAERRPGAPDVPGSGGQEARTTGPGTAATAAVGRPRSSARDLVDVGVFGALYVVVGYVVGMLGIVSPLAWLIAVPLTVVANGVTYTLFATRVRRPGPVALLGVLVACFFLVSGNTLVGTAAILVLAVLADLVLRSGGYRSRWAVVASYAVFGLAHLTPFLPLLYDREGYLSGAAWSEMGDEYVSAAEALLSGPVVAALAAGVLLAGVLGGLLGGVLLRRHFARAGLA